MSFNFAKQEMVLRDDVGTLTEPTVNRVRAQLENLQERVHSGSISYNNLRAALDNICRLMKCQ